MARNKLLPAQQSGDTDKIQAAVEAAITAGLKPKYIKETLAGVTSDQRMFEQLSKTDQLYLINQATPDQRERYLPFAKRETQTQWYTEHPPQ